MPAAAGAFDAPPAPAPKRRTSRPRCQHRRTPIPRAQVRPCRCRRRVRQRAQAPRTILTNTVVTSDDDGRFEFNRSPPDSSDAGQQDRLFDARRTACPDRPRERAPPPPPIELRRRRNRSNGRHHAGPLAVRSKDMCSTSWAIRCKASAAWMQVRFQAVGDVSLARAAPHDQLTIAVASGSTLPTRARIISATIGDAGTTDLPDTRVSHFPAHLTPPRRSSCRSDPRS